MSQHEGGEPITHTVAATNLQVVTEVRQDTPVTDQQRDEAARAVADIVTSRLVN